MKGKIAIVSDGRHSLSKAIQISEAYEQGRADGARDFAEWLCRKSDYTDIDINGFTTCRCGASPKDTTIEQALAEWQKEVNNAE